MTVEEIKEIGEENVEDLLYGVEGKEIFIPHMKERKSERGVGQINFDKLEIFILNVHNSRIKNEDGSWFDKKNESGNYCCRLIIESDRMKHEVTTNPTIKNIIRSQRLFNNSNNFVKENKFDNSEIKVYLSKTRYNWRLAFYLTYMKEDKEYLICSVVTQETFEEIFSKCRKELNKLSNDGRKIYIKYLKEQKEFNRKQKELSTEELLWFLNL